MKKNKKKQHNEVVQPICDILDASKEVINEVFPVNELKTDDVRSLICGGWFNHNAKIDVYVFHRCDFFEVRIQKMEKDMTMTHLGSYILLALNNGFDSHVCQFNDGEKDILIGYNAYRDEIVFSPSGMEFERTTCKNWDRFAESMRQTPSLKEEAFDQEDQIFRKGYVSLEGDENLKELNSLFKDMLGHEDPTQSVSDI